jgi:hypothetical protein
MGDAKVDEEKQKLEVEKLKAEIKALQRPTDRWIGYLVGVTGFLAGCAGLFAAFYQVSQLKNQHLESQIQLERTQYDLQVTKDALLKNHAENGLLSNNIVSLKSQESDLTTQVGTEQSKISNLLSSVQTISNQQVRIAAEELAESARIVKRIAEDTKNEWLLKFDPTGSPFEEHLNFGYGNEIFTQGVAFARAGDRTGAETNYYKAIKVFDQIGEKWDYDAGAAHSDRRKVERALAALTNQPPGK